jgi:hypothetical protein
MRRKKKKEKARKLSAGEKRKLVKEWLAQSDSEDKMTMAEYDKEVKRKKARDKVKRREEAKRKKKFKNKDPKIFLGFNTVKS